MNFSTLYEINVGNKLVAPELNEKMEQISTDYVK